jgi:hypothetical protein
MNTRRSTTTEPGASRRGWWLLAGGHAVLLAAAVALFGPAAVYTTAPDPSVGHIGAAAFLGGLVSIAVGQAMSLHTLWTIVRALRARDLTANRLVRAAHRSEWAMALALYPALACLFQSADPLPGSIFTPVVVLLLAAPLLDQVQALWIYRQLGAATLPAATVPAHPEHRVLPPGAGALTRRRQGFAALFVLVFAVAGAILLVATLVTEADRFSTAPAAAIVHVSAAIAAAVIPALYIPAVRRMRRAIVGDAVHLPSFAQAARRLTHATVLAAGLAVPIVAALFIAPAVVELAAVRPVMLAVAIGVGGSPHFAALTYLHFGALQRADVRRLQRRKRGEAPGRPLPQAQPRLGRLPRGER